MKAAAFPLVLRVVLALTPFAAVSAGELVDGKFGKALDVTRGYVQVQGGAACGTVPLTFECWAKLDAKAQYNVLAAYGPKSDPSHWELFTQAGSGLLCAYLPGRKPDHARSACDIVDSKWHYLALVLESSRARLFVDGVEKANTALTPPTPPAAPAPFTLGALNDGQFQCQGRLDEARLSKGAREIPGSAGVPPARAGETPALQFAADADTLGLWHFEQLDGGSVKDSSSQGRHGKFVASTLAAGGGQGIPRVSTEFRPLPQPEDAGPARKALKETAERLNLRSIAGAAFRDGVLRAWLYDYTWFGKLEYPQHRQPWYQDKAEVAAQVYDAQALIRDDDGGPAGTVLRRTAALAAHLEKLGAHDRIAAFEQDLETLRAAFAKEQPKPDSAGSAGVPPAVAGETPALRTAGVPPAISEGKAFYLAACALRRQIALANPLLDFDQILFVARGTFADSVRSNPTTGDAQGGHMTTQYFGCVALPGGGLFAVKDFKTDPRIVNVLQESVVRNGRLQGAKLDSGAFATPDLAFDGRRIAFAWTENKEHAWGYGTKSCFHLFTANSDGTELRQLTDGGYNDFDPCWLPNGRLAFVSERRGGHIRCFDAYLKVRNYTLFSMQADGADMRPLSYFETSEWNPTVNNDGQIVFTRWDYTDRENCLGTRLWLCGQDGSDPRAPHGNYPHPYHTFPGRQPWKTWNGRELDSRIGAPLVEMGIRAVPDSPLYVFTASPHHGEVFGSLCVLDLRQPDDGHMSQLRRITPEEPFPESEMPGRRHYKYGTPWPLSADFFLCNVWEDLALVDRYGNKELLCELALLPCAQDERLRLIDPQPLRARPMPATAGSAGVPPARAGETPAPQTAAGGTPALPGPARKATIAVMNVYDSDLPFPPGTKIKWLRITQNILKANHAMGEPMIGYERENTPRVPLGLVPVEEDGSAYFEAPVAKELIFQVLDENYMAVQSMRSSAFVHPGEQLTCRGCHEHVQTAPAIKSEPLALRREPSQVRPECGPVEPISYYRQIKPIFETKCVGCHAEKKKGPVDMSYAALKEGYTFWFSGAMWQDMCRPYSGVHGGSRTIPGQFGARNSRIGKALLDENHKEVSAEDRHKIILWLDSNSLRLSAYIREAAQLRGELVWPELDVDPENVLGVEGRGRPLSGNFWHENLWGARPVLVSSHTLDKVCILNAAAEIVWDYSVSHPQDVWMLPNGNILTTHRLGVQELTRDKKIVWEYKVEPPNEVPACQPLPDGNVLIGIVGQCRLIEVDRQGAIVHQVQLSTTETQPHAQFRMCRKTALGTYLVPFTAEGAVREYATDGKLLREFPRKPMPVCALRLENGNTLISAGKSVTEYAPDNRVVWELTEQDVPDINIAVPAGVQRLPNGNTVVCNWNTKDDGSKLGAHVFEVTPDKRVVWHIAGAKIGQVAQCQLLTPELGPRGEQVAR
ncbi:MAG: LamG-like jellyroll fold domain-containing protein [Planctomycetota bacterium]